jgi:dienelactone hydrolase
MRVSWTVAALVSLALSGVCGAQPPSGVTPEMIATSLPLEGAPKAEPGPYQVTAEPASGAAGLRTFRPANLAGFPQRDTLPVVVWGNGGCAVDNPRYAGFLTTIASHGFLVITTTGAASEGAPRRQATADDLEAAIDWAEKENKRAGSPLNGKIDTRHVAVMGQSCGGFLSLALGADPRVGTIGVFNSGVQAGNPDGSRSSFPTADALQKLHGPVLLINGGERDFMMARSRATYDAIESLPAFYGSRHGAGHTATAYHPGGGEFANVAWKWVQWQFKGDKQAAAMFVGTDCGLCANKNWDVASKRLK